MNKQVVFNKQYGGVNYRCGDYGVIGMFVGDASAGKSTMLTPIITSAISSQPNNGWDINIEGDTYHINTEDSEFILEESRNKILEATNPKYHKRYHAYNITDIDTPEGKFQEVRRILEQAIPKSLILTDVLSDLISDINNVTESNVIISSLASLVKDKQLILCVCNHLNNQGTSSGFIGKRFVQKASFGYSLQLDTKLGITFCKPIKRKFGYLPTFGFYVTDNGDYKEVPFNPFPNI